MLTVNVSELIFYVIFYFPGNPERRTAVRRQPGAATRSRTLDLLITSELLYRLSYGGSKNPAPIWRVAKDRRCRSRRQPESQRSGRSASECYICTNLNVVPGLPTSSRWQCPRLFETRYSMSGSNRKNT